MPSTGATLDWAWVDVAVPRRSARLPGISMAGFRHRAPYPVDIAMVAHPSVTLLVDLTEGGRLGYDTQGRHQRGSVVIGLLPGDLRVTGRGIGECLQIRLEPDAAAAVLGASTDLSGAMLTMVVAPAATASAARAGDSAWTYHGVDVCGLTSARLVVDEPRDPFTYRHRITFHEATFPTCEESAPRTPNPDYQVATRMDLYWWDGGEWTICRNTDWWITSVPSISIGGGATLSEPPCGAGYYDLVGYSYVYVDGSWVGDAVRSGYSYASGS